MQTVLEIQTVLSLTLADGGTGQFPRVLVYDPTGSLDDTVDLTHLANGVYTGNWTSSVKGNHTALFIVYSDAGHTTENLVYSRSQEIIDVLAEFEDGAVWVNQFEGGNDSNPGTAEYPVATLSRAKVIATANNLRRFRIQNCSQVLTETFSNFEFISDDVAGVRYIGLNGQVAQSSSFHGITLDGTLGGSFTIIGAYHCLFFGPMAELAGGILDTYFLAFVGDKFGLKDDVATTFVRCSNASAEGGDPLYGPVVFEVSGTKQNIQFSQWSGSMAIDGLDGANSKIRVDLESGEVEVLNTCTAGEIIISGNGRVINNTGGAIVRDRTTRSKVEINSAISESGTDLLATVWWSHDDKVETSLFSSVSAVVKNSAGTQVLNLGAATEIGGRFAWTGLIATITIGDGFSLEVTADGEIFAIPFARN